MKTITFIMGLMTSALCAQAQTYFYVSALEVIPENPTNMDEISIHVFGSFASTGSYIVSHEITVDGSIVNLEINCADPGGLTVLVPHDTIFSVGILGGGEYMITLGGQFTGDFVEDNGDYFFQVDGPNSLDEVEVNEPSLILSGRMMELILPQSLRGRVLQIMDVQGRLVLKRPIQSIPMSPIDLSGLRQGNYILRISMDQRDWTRSIPLE